MRDIFIIIFLLLRVTGDWTELKQIQISTNNTRQRIGINVSYKPVVFVNVLSEGGFFAPATERF